MVCPLGPELVELGEPFRILHGSQFRGSWIKEVKFPLPGVPLRDRQATAGLARVPIVAVLRLAALAGPAGAFSSFASAFAVSNAPAGATGSTIAPVAAAASFALLAAGVSGAVVIQ